ncbi:copper homeostasis periplasmic binding protein CopC [Burkholderia sp. FERM BP-3421]|jgi:methionine-rich copper-binding protein CopC|uniref:copper homeostasis periplasmic binding protein CopC n=1 Tax=Burkholderia sp. FERM BP-3421 TaxID=1494466 RepID=UPI00235FE8B4|nr:copper homeostasis periplasmic binding protein CopC [Burkholderia sp. FERM BP-3421]WDD95007.1 copper homeostasis periplasmic binding protein CopC [Burkholderia sp. FERM BP-3421]
MTSILMPLARRGALAVLALTLSAAAFAHAKPEHSEPAANAVVTDAPHAVAIDFTEPLEPAFSSIVVTDAAGQPAADGRATIDAANRKRMSVALKPIAAGDYTVRWVAVATDGHRTQGSYRFSVK